MRLSTNHHARAVDARGRAAFRLALAVSLLGAVLAISGAQAGGDPTSATPSTAAAAVEILTIDADSLRITLELPIAALAPTGTVKLADPKRAHSAIVSPDSLAGYLKTRMILIQDDGMLVPVIRRITIPKSDPAIARVEMVAGLLDTYTHIGVASGLFREQPAPLPTKIQVEWRGARAEFGATQAIQWVEPPAKGATVLELPGRNPDPAAAGH